MYFIINISIFFLLATISVDLSYRGHLAVYLVYMKSEIYVLLGNNRELKQTKILWRLWKLHIKCIKIYILQFWQIQFPA